MACRLSALAAIAAFAFAAVTAAGCGSDDGSGEVPGTVTTQVTLDMTSDQTTGSSGKAEEKGGGSGDGGAATGSQSAGKSKGSAKCTRANISDAVRSWGADQDTRASVAGPNFQCAGSWAAALVIIGPPATGDASTVVLKVASGGWRVQNRSKVCPKPSPVPGQIYSLACQSN